MNVPSHAPRPTDVVTQALTAAAGGDETAYADLYGAVAQRVHRRVLAVLRDEHQAEEVTQEVMLEVWQRAHRFDPREGSALGWVLTMARRRAVDRVRASAASRRRDTEHHERTGGRPYDETAAAVEISLDARLVREALASLPAAQRQALELAYFRGHTHAEVSELTRVSLGTAKFRIRAGLQRLRVSLGPQLLMAPDAA